MLGYLFYNKLLRYVKSGGSRKKLAQLTKDEQLEKLRQELRKLSRR